MNHDYERMSPFDQIKSALHEAISHARGELTLKTTTLPPPPPSMPPARVIRLRKRLGMSQRIFAAYLNVSTKLVQTWEHGSRVPRGGALRLLELFELQSDVVRMMQTPNSRSSHGNRKKPARISRPGKLAPQRAVRF